MTVDNPTVTHGGKWCLGHGVVGKDEALRLGHYVEPHLVGDVFSVNTHDTSRAKGLGTTGLRPRCKMCRSIRRWHDDHGNAHRRASAFRTQHAERWVKKGRHPTVDAALREMDIGGVTAEAVAQLILAAVGEDCPGLCAHQDGQDIVIHTIDRVADMHVDVRDPNQPFSIENIGILCSSCNPAKNDRPWALFVYERRACLRAMRDAIDRADYRRTEQATLFDVA